MAHHARVRRNSSRRRPYAWLGAGVVGVGLALAGAGAAHADDTSGAAESSSARALSSAAAAPGGSAAAPRSAAARSLAVASRSVRGQRSVSAAAASDRRTPARVAAVAGRRVPGVAVGAAVSSPVAVSASTASAGAGVVTPVPSEATIAVTNWFSSTRGWLNGFDGPVAGVAQDVLYGVQRTLFSPAPTVTPMQYSIWTAGEPILGALQYVQPGGAAVGMELTQAPTLGTVQLLSSGAYTYTPGPDFTGTDSFTAAVTAGGFNLLEPFTPRTASVVVDINPSPPVMSPRGYSITNQSANGVYLAFIRKESGYENSVFSPPVGTILKPGETLRLGLEKTWSSYTTYFTFYGCSDESCGPSSPTTNKEWTVQLYYGKWLGGFDVTQCLGTGWCSRDDGTGINISQRGGNGDEAYDVNLLDTKAPDYVPLPYPL